jgi:hypothetical protein
VEGRMGFQYLQFIQKKAASINFRQNTDTGTNEAVKNFDFGVVPQ